MRTRCRAGGLPEGAAPLRQATDSLIRFISGLSDRSSRNLAPSQLQELCDSLKRYLITSTRGGVNPIPKCHMSMHMAHR
eukprot:3302970-Pyramimonas_sp.AAC.1